MTHMRVALWLAVSTERQAKEDKISLKEQERVGREWAAAQPNAQIVKVFYWDGYSRSETDVLTAYEDFASEGRYEYHELRQMWQSHGFDVLWVYVHDRIARSAALYAQVMGNVIKSGARIYSHSDGWIDASNVETFMAIGGFSAAGDIRKLVKRREMGMRNRLQRGLSTTSSISETHIRLRDPITGREIGLAVNEEKRRLFDDAATLILEGVSWGDMEKQLYRRFGHTQDNGNPLSRSRIYKLMTKPLTWGHNAIGYRLDRPKGSWAKIGEWILEPGHEIPRGVTIEYNILPPLYEGELAERLKNEIKFRMSNVRGHTPSQQKYWFTGLVVCDECGYYMAIYNSEMRQPRLKCVSHWNQSHSHPDCDQRTSIKEDYLKVWLMVRVDEMIETGRFTLLPEDQTQADLHEDKLIAEVQKLETQIGGMSRRQAEVTGKRYEILEVEINKALALLEIKSKRLLEIQMNETVSQRTRQEQKQALSQIETRGWEWFWSNNATFIRSSFIAILADGRLAGRDGQIRKVVPKPKAQTKN